MEAHTSTESADPAAALRELEESLRDCRRCGLCSGRTQVVFGVGSPFADLMFVGEGPGFHEDRQGEPFVGAAGKLLTALLGQIGLSRSEVYIANVVKCRPPENRDPTDDEIKACSPHLMQQMAIIRPRVVCTLGRFATRLLTGTELSMTAIHGKAKAVRLGGFDTIVFPVFHPAAALYASANRSVLEEDFSRLRRLLDHGTSALRGGESASPPAGSDAAGAAPDDPAERGLSDSPSPAGSSSSPPSGSKGPSNTAEQLPLW